MGFQMQSPSSPYFTAQQQMAFGTSSSASSSPVSNFNTIATVPPPMSLPGPKQPFSPRPPPHQIIVRRVSPSRLIHPHHHTQTRSEPHHSGATRSHHHHHHSHAGHHHHPYPPLNLSHRLPPPSSNASVTAQPAFFPARTPGSNNVDRSNHLVSPRFMPNLPTNTPTRRGSLTTTALSTLADLSESVLMGIHGPQGAAIQRGKPPKIDTAFPSSPLNPSVHSQRRRGGRMQGPHYHHLISPVLPPLPSREPSSTSSGAWSAPSSPATRTVGASPPADDKAAPILAPFHLLMQGLGENRLPALSDPVALSTAQERDRGSSVEMVEKEKSVEGGSLHATDELGASGTSDTVSPLFSTDEARGTEELLPPAVDRSPPEQYAMEVEENETRDRAGKRAKKSLERKEKRCEAILPSTTESTPCQSSTSSSSLISTSSTPLHATDPLPPTQPSYPCPHPSCTSAFPRRHLLRAHITTHNPIDRPHPCPYPSCDSRFRRRQEMLRHCRSVHGGDDVRPWVCPGSRCGRRFARGDALRRHLEAMRAQTGPRGCSFGLSKEEIMRLVSRSCKGPMPSPLPKGMQVGKKDEREKELAEEEEEGFEQDEGGEEAENDEE
ncbi:hypothetical protein HDU67_004670 [Dinochytrium kinnereticum]|nr:hypothetical protein HDU67_004670 [Dinochytrium kinnereticum]